MSSCRGNVFIYILIAVVLLAGLTFAISNNSSNTATADVSAAQISASVTSILSYAAAAQTAINQMTTSGTELDDILFTLPSDATFNTAPTMTKFYHPDGGGFTYKPLPGGSVGTAVTAPVNGFYIGKIANIEWTPTAASDFIFMAYGLSGPVCNALNNKILAWPHIPTTTKDFKAIASSLYSTGSSASTFVKADCVTPANCDERPALCVLGSDGSYSFINILFAR